MVGRIVGRMYAATIAQLPTLLVLRAALWWRRLDLAAKQAVAASLAVVAGLAIAAWLVAGHIEETIIHRAGAATALYTDSFVAAHAQELATNPFLRPSSPAIQKRLNMEGRDLADIFGEIRKRKDKF